MSTVMSLEEMQPVKVRSLLKKLNSRTDGLTDQEIQSSREKHGFNEITEHHKNPFLKFLSYFWGPIPVMIEVAAILSILVHHYTDFGIIMTLLLMNTLVGFWHDNKADNAIEMLKKRLAPKARVKRNNKWQILEARELVPGDVIRLRLGDIIPADIKLISGDYLECDESMLTGESLPVEKHILDTAYSGSVITRGEMDAVVTETGLDTYFGKTAKLVDQGKSKSHFEQAVIRIGNYLIILAVVLVALIFMVALFRHDNLMETLRFAMVLTVASIPVALPAILTVTMAIGAMNLARKKVIVSRLAAIEELAGMDILCSDKTGTLTQNKLTVGETVAAKNYSDEEVLLYAALASRAEDNDPIDTTILSKTDKNEHFHEQFEQYKTSEFKPFDPVVKRTEVTIKNRTTNQTYIVSKGAPQVIFKLINNRSETEEFAEKVNDYAQMGYRMIAVALQEKDKWQLVGLIPLFDPPREDSRDTIRNATEMGILVKMVTGDNQAIARQISERLGLGDFIVSGDQLDKVTNHKLDELVEKSDGFSQVFPEHKFSIVKVLQRLGHFVGMTGDGVNDAPALKNADCGIAVDGATDAAKSAASIVLTSPGLSVIVDAIKESRKIFQRMNSYSIYRIAETIRVLFFITVSILVFNFYPITALMIVLLALLNDAPIMAIATDNVHYSQMPEKWNMRKVLGLGTVLGIVGVVSSFMIFYIGREILNLHMDVLQSFIFLKLAVAGHLTIFLARTRKPFWSIKPSGGLLWSAILTKVVATLFAVYGWFISPIGWRMAGYIWAYSIGAFLITDVIKVYYYKWFLPEETDNINS
ncbi:MAG: plasma-membrane proton-efflux P-type ATPase [Calditrichae bacterium]|nr:plasma-membrane proton-efflux P-type ATPase [Calditrichota bacterium]MCB9058181.1 plasma-membrane proton-efflux P-type ATPase [Calditrichia bacterium]